MTRQLGDTNIGGDGLPEVKIPKLSEDGKIVNSSFRCFGSTNRETFLANGQAMTERLLYEVMEAVAKDYGDTDVRIQLLRKGPQGFEEFSRLLTHHSGLGSALTFRVF